MEIAHDIPADLFAFLASPASYGVDGPVDIVETHASLVFLAGDEAYKIYKHLKLPYLDFSTLAKRKQVAAREYDLNHVNAPSLYLGLVPIARNNAGYAFNGHGAVVDYAVRMRRFPQTNLLSAVAARGELGPALIEAVADLVALLHQRAPPHIGFDHAAELARIAEDQIHAFADAPDIFDAIECSQWAHKMRETLRRNADLLRNRSAAGFVRRCHGDLHLNNLVLLDGAPTPFDALEFDEDLATTDVFYDLAFLLMDLTHRGLDVEANMALSDYCARLEAAALAGLAALPLWMSLRAAIRARVAADRAAEIGTGPGAGAARAAGRAYFRTAQRLIETDPPQLLAIGGLSGTGKTTLARRLSPRLSRPIGALHLRSDVERKIMAGVAPSAALPRASYTKEGALEVYRRVREKADVALRAGFSVVVDAVHSSDDARNALEDITTTAGAQFLGVWLDAPAAVMKSRVNARTGDASDADETVVERQLRRDPGTINWRRVDACALDDGALPDWLERELQRG
jgi:aminoglycoside phosphotransferase family enzyme/predicted kinase